MNNRRLLIVILFMMAAMFMLASKLFTIQVSNHEKYLSMAERQQNKSIKIKAERGLITDRNREVLSFTQNDVSLYVDTRMVNSVKRKTIAEKLASVFGKSSMYYIDLMNNSTKNVCLEKKVSKEDALKLEEFTVEGFFIEEDFTRKYPYGSLASHILGHVDVDENGVAGIEKVLNSSLRGNDGLKFVENDVLGRIVSVKDEDSKFAVPGNNVVLTINKTYQQILEQELAEGVEKYKGNSGVGIIMNPHTGEILALSNIPDFDPNNYNLFDDFARRNRALTDTYEPGSTIKPIIMSMLIEEGLANPNEIIDTENGQYRVPGAFIRDTHEFEHLTVRQVVEQSSNIGMAKLSTRIEPDLFYKYLRDFGFGNLTSIDLPGEDKGFLKKPKNFSRISKRFISFGYEISVTPLQLLTAYSAVINGGTLYKPQLIKEVKDYKGNVIQSFESEKIRNVISQRTSDMVIDFMIGVVEEGTGKNARLESVLVGGKTGTSQKLVDGKYSSQDYNSSFVGFLPADNPKIICLIMIDAPKVGRYGGQVAAPIFHRVASRIIEADLSIVPDDYKIKRDEKLIDELFVNINSLNESPIFTAANLPDTQSEETEQHYENNREFMPNLINRSKREAVRLLNELKLKFEISGNGNVIAQSIEPGSTIFPDQMCVIECEAVQIKSNIRIY